MAELLLGVDVGSSGTKGVLVTPDGSAVAAARRRHELMRPQPGWVEHDPESVWWGELVSVCRELTESRAEAVAAVGCSGMGPTVVVAGEDGRPLRPAILYGIDTRARREIEELGEALGQDAILARCGSPLTSQAVGPKLAWIARHEPDVWDATRMWLTTSSYLVHRLTGAYVLDHHSASQSDPLYELSSNAWIPEWADRAAPGLRLPRLLWPAEVAGTVSPEAAEATGLVAGTPVVAGTIDTWAEAAGAGVRAPGEMLIMYGTTMFLVEVLTEARPHPRLWSTASLRPGTHNLAGGMASAGALTQWWASLTSGDYGALALEAAQVAPGSDGLVALPYFSGERAPLFDPRARGLICGLTLGHGRAHVYRALLEATAYASRHILEVMAEAGGGSDERIVAVGGGTGQDLWTQIVSDVTGRSQEIPRETAGAPYGDALLAAAGTGLASLDAPWNQIDRAVEPRLENRPVYDMLYGVYRELYPATQPQAHALADLHAPGDR